MINKKNCFICINSYISLVIQYFFQFFSNSSIWLVLFKLMPFLNGLSYRNELGGIWKVLQSRFISSCGFCNYFVKKWSYLCWKVNEDFCPRLYKRAYPSVRPSVRRSGGELCPLSFYFWLFFSQISSAARKRDNVLKNGEKNNNLW